MSVTYVPSSSASTKAGSSSSSAAEPRRLSSTRVRAIESALAAMVRGVLPDPAPGTTGEAPGFEQVQVLQEAVGAAGQGKGQGQAQVFRLTLPRSSDSPSASSTTSAATTAAAGGGSGAPALDGQDLVIEVTYSPREESSDVTSQLARPMLTYQQAVAASIEAAKERTGQVARAAATLRIVPASPRAGTATGAGSGAGGAAGAGAAGAGAGAGAGKGEELVRMCEVLDDTESRQKAVREATKKKK